MDTISIDEAYKILVQDSGKHFDEEIVNVFIEIRNEVETYVKEQVS